jgi:hypothetical protein
MINIGLTSYLDPPCNRHASTVTVIAVLYIVMKAGPRALDKLYHVDAPSYQFRKAFASYLPVCPLY